MRPKQANSSRKNRQGRGLARRALTLAVVGILALSPLLTAEEAAAAARG